MSTRSAGVYAAQHRGGADDYATYFAGMDASMQQKVALTTAHFPPRGRVADMGSGSGRGTYDLACLYGGLELVGVDINPVSVAMAAERFVRPNLRYLVGDIADPVFEPASLDGVLDSSVLHHVTSFNDFSTERLEECLDNQVRALRPGGVIIVRDFVVPDGPAEVLLDLPEGDGTAALFERFARDFRSSQNRTGPVPFERLSSERAGHVRHRVALRAATEFLLRKDYREDWDVELAEEYTYFTQAEFEAAFRRRGLRIVTSMPILNPWIVAHRFEGKFHWTDLGGAPLPFPPTNYLIVGEKVPRGEGVLLREARSAPLVAPNFLALSAHRDEGTGRVLEVVERPGRTLDVVPWFRKDGQIFVVAKKGFPRPIVNACADHPRLGGASYSGYITEPIAAIVHPGEAAAVAIPRVLQERAGVSPERVRAVSEPLRYFTSPGGVNERVAGYLVEIEPGDFGLPAYGVFAKAGSVRELDARQVLRACHVGGLFDARLEINVHRLLAGLGISPGPWIGANIAPSPQPRAPGRAADALKPPRRAPFVPHEGISGYLDLRTGHFEEVCAEGRVVGEAPREYLVPRAASRSTVAALPFLLAEGEIWIGIEHRDLPAVQHFTGSAAIAVTPAYRLPRDLSRLDAVPQWLAGRLAEQFGLSVRRMWDLGGAYLPTPGVTPEIVLPFAVEVDAEGADARGLRWCSLREWLGALESVQDAHLLVLGWRLSHALGVLGRGGEGAPPAT
ncbi:methyltransferase domain-containing protein [Polyangium aurulentum]|uniref:methyltransferase domain-containing protein n=1 Tax=Polyangium aurulentum TaxID=2567896 RepID=UPI0010AE8A36|nr:methyltransferase domain-containing protein [Polyangium aurulentum]UQA62455.1 methyltransferase domain-containing protein [Polyangium aurulentum]